MSHRASGARRHEDGSPGAREPLKMAGLIHDSWPEGRAKSRFV